MIVDEQAIDSAILGMFFEPRLPAAGRLAYTTLQQEWPRHEFRAADLDPGLIRLLRRGYLRIVDEDEVRIVVLTDSGRRHGRSLGSTLGLLRARLEWFCRALGLVEPRQQRSACDSARRHRAADPQAAAELLRTLRQP